NLAMGHGIVWNPGEYVEGYTNFLWVLILAAGMRLGLSPETLSNALGVASGAGVLLVLGRFYAGRLTALHPIVWLPLFTLALSRSFTAWSTSGLATQFFSLLILIAQIQFLKELENPERRAWLSSLVFALATLTRPEGGLFTFVAGLFLLWRVARGQMSLRALCIWVLPWALIVGAHFLWRYGYYGAWLPNTFHAKVNGFWPEQAGHYFAIFQADYKIAYYIPLILLGVLRSREPAHRFFSASILVYCAYLVSIGGGRFEFRFLVVILPTLYWLIAEGLRSLLDSEPPGKPAFVVLGIAAAMALLATTHLGSISPAAKLDRHHIESIESTRDYANERARQGKILAGYIEAEVLDQDMQICVGGAGALPYYTGWPTLDFRGLNDPRIAQTPLKERGTIAHEHFASADYLRERRVIVFDSLNNLVHEGDVSSFANRAALRGDRHWKLRAVDLGEHSIVFSTLVDEATFQQSFRNAKILF
ncbi:MAG: arabinofuranosyltransferase, partial [Myxococcota bacterium]